jgi:hypothetical protein
MEAQLRDVGEYAQIRDYRSTLVASTQTIYIQKCWNFQKNKNSKKCFWEVNEESFEI